MSALPNNNMWTLHVEGDKILDVEEARRALSLLMLPGERHEIRVAPSWASIVIDVADMDAAVAAMLKHDSEHSVFYYSLNPIKGNAPKATAKDVLRRRWFLIDVDPIRDGEACSTEAEKARAGEVVDAILDDLSLRGWPPCMVIDSGNGWHLLYRVDLPNNDLSKQILKECLLYLDKACGNDHAKIDSSVHNAGRIAKLPGTWSRKGADTADRPHRQAKIIHAPDNLDVVPIALLKALGKPKDEKAPAKPKSPSDPWTLAAGAHSLTNYVEHAIARECAAVATTPKGDRDIRYNKAVFNIATMANWPELDESKAKASLRAAAQACGLDEYVADEKLSRVWEEGRVAPPRVRPEPKAEASAVATIPEGESVTVSAADVDPLPVEWLWQDRIAIGFISLFAGRTGVGKSFVLCDIAAKLSTGREFPDGSPPKPVSGTLFISEDPYQYVLVPRLKELGANLPLIRFMKWEAMAKYSLRDTEFLNRAWEESGKPSLIVIDPPANFLGAKDEHKNAEIREVLMQIVAWLESRCVGMVFITHYNKGGGDKALDALDRIMGSVAWASSARIACGFQIDPGDQSKCVFGGIKNNLGEKAGPLSYRIAKTETLAVVEWLGKSDTTLDDALNQKAPRKVSAVEFLMRHFRQQRCWPSNELYHLGKVEGVSRDALFEAKKALPIGAALVYPQDGGAKFWEWQAQPGWPPEENVATVATLATVNHNPNDSNINLRVDDGDNPATITTHSKSRKVSVRRKEEIPDDDRRAIKLLAGMLFAGPVERDRAVGTAGEQGIPAESMDRAAVHFGVDVDMRDGKETWSLL